jgi:hypothetical protein
MLGMDSGDLHLRVVRSAVFSGVSVALSAGGRQAVTGDATPVLTILVAFGIVFGVALLLSSGERGFASIAATLVPLELALNALFNTGRRGCLSGVGNLICGGGTARPSAGETLQPHGLVSLSSGQIMLLLLLNLMALLVVALWLRQGEAAVFTLLRTAAMMLWSGCSALLAWLVVRPTAVPFFWSPPPGEPPLLRAQAARLAVAPRRGPPSSVLV